MNYSDILSIFFIGRAFVAIHFDTAYLVIIRKILFLIENLVKTHTEKRKEMGIIKIIINIIITNFIIMKGIVNFINLLVFVCFEYFDSYFHYD